MPDAPKLLTVSAKAPPSGDHRKDQKTEISVFGTQYKLKQHFLLHIITKKIIISIAFFIQKSRLRAESEGPPMSHLCYSHRTQRRWLIAAPACDFKQRARFRWQMRVDAYLWVTMWAPLSVVIYKKQPAFLSPASPTRGHPLRFPLFGLIWYGVIWLYRHT